VVVVGGSVALSSQTEKKTVKELEAILSRSIPITLIDNPMDVAHCKLIFNLGNALMTMVAFHENRSRQLKELQQITANITWEGVQVLKKHGVKEVKVPGLPSWKLLRLSLMLPSFIAVPIFKKKMEATAINSMAQDLEKGSGQTELEDLNGYFIGLAERVGVEIPYNKAIYEIFRMWELSGTQSLTPAEVLEKVNSFSNR
jgi:ketopantoate reductase